MKYYFLLILCFFTACFARIRVKAVVCNPIADASHRSLGKASAQCYKMFPIAPDSGPTSFLRLHQFLYNQVVTIVKEQLSGEVLVEVPSLFYLDARGKKRNDFWMLKQDLVLIKALPKKVHHTIPDPIDFSKPVADYSKNIITLTRPFSLPSLGVCFSVGTRFVRVSQKDTEDAYAFWVTDYRTKKSTLASVAKSFATISPTSRARSKRLFMSLLRSWSSQPAGIVPYVFGGCSFIGTIAENGFKKTTGLLCGKKATYWQRVDYTAVPQNGFDCSSSILCAAQIAGLPYYCKNTLALAKNLGALKQSEALEEGDLIWYSGHVLIVSDYKKNLVIEAVGYEAGYGRMHELPLSEVFHRIRNFEQLEKAYHAQKFMYRMNSKGKPWRSVYKIKLLKLSCNS